MQEKFSISTHSSLAQIGGDKSFSEFDVVTAWHVLEHVPDLKETIENGFDF